MEIDIPLTTQELEEIQPGETISINHKDCPAGEDTRSRLYITRPATTPDMMLAYCHNCQTGGSTKVPFTPYRAPKSTTDELLLQDLEIKGLKYNSKDWPEDAMIWANSNKVTEDMIQFGGIAYSPQHHRMYLPIWFSLHKDDHPYKLQGYQLRRINNRGPKYITCVKNNRGHLGTIMGVESNKSQNKWCVVEDYISALHIMEATETVGVLVNYGVDIKPEALQDLHGRVFIWLDNDSSHVDRQAFKMKRVLKLLGCSPIVVNSNKDPKHHTPQQIREALEE